MKKRNLIILAGALLLAACQTNKPKETVLKGSLTELPSDTLIVTGYYVNDISQEHMWSDFIVAQQGAFTLPIKNDSLPVMVELAPVGRESSQDKYMILVMPGETVNVTGSIDNYQMEGSPLNQAYLEATRTWLPYIEKGHAAEARCDSMRAAGVNDDSIQSYYLNTYCEYETQRGNAELDYVREHKDEDVALYAFYRLGLIDHELITSMSDQVKNGPLSSLYQALEQVCLERKMQREALKGQPAPDFTLKDMQGKDFTLSSLRGKYVILDFWGSWCVWCIKGFPKLKEYYAKYKDRLEIVGISCHDTESRWKAAVKKYKLPWLNVFEGESNITKTYNVDGFPTTILIDPEGKIITTQIMDYDMEKVFGK